LKITPAAARVSDPVKVSVTVANTGTVKGDEVVELYLGTPGSPAGTVRALKGFKRVALDAAASTQVEFVLEARDLSAVDDKGTRTVKPGPYTLFVGGAQPGGSASGVEGSFHVSGTGVVPR
jgi:beta-glucosidase